MARNLAAILFDLGDTIMREETEVKDETGTTLRAELIPGMAELLRSLKRGGHRLALVADARPQTPPNVLRAHGLYDLFEHHVISENIGTEKPDARMFTTALDFVGVERSDYPRVVMVGNNLERDMVGANRLGIISIFLHTNETRRTIPITEEERPTHTVHSADELAALLEQLDVAVTPARQ